MITRRDNGSSDTGGAIRPSLHPESASAGRPVARRGLLGVAVGSVAALAGAAAFLSRPARALAAAYSLTSADPDATYEIDNSDQGTGVWGRNTALASSPNTSPAPYSGLYGTSGATGTGVVGHSTGAVSSYGVWGTTDVGIGVIGAMSGSAGFGIVGSNSADGTGVYGSSTGGGTGVYGQSNNAIGFWGVTTTSGQGLANAAVVGTNQGGGTALVGFTDGPGSIGLAGASNTGTGAYGSSQSYIGLFGYTETGYAVVAVANSKGGLAGEFVGPVLITGSLTVYGAKSAAVKTKSGLKRLYCMESPESWFEDFGSGQLNQGKTTVSLEPGFAEIVRTDSYHVFLTPHDESEGLYVTQRNSSGFTVQEHTAGRATSASVTELSPSERTSKVLVWRA
jgi:hypothetical protein